MVLAHAPIHPSILAVLTTVIGVTLPPNPGQFSPASICWKTLTCWTVSVTVVVVTEVDVEVVVEVVKMVAPVVTVVVLKRETVEGDATHEHARETRDGTNPVKTNGVNAVVWEPDWRG